jgi:ComF family protein
VAAFGAHTGALRKAIHHLKFNHETRFAAVLAPLLAQTLQKSGWDVTLITGIPLSAQRQAERGYNQASLLANELARIVRRSCSERLVVRTRETQSQVGLGFADRQVNMKGAFQADSTLAQGQRVLIVDDVFTTGATLRNCGQALYSAGAACVWGLTVACAIPRPDSSGDLDHEP